MEDSLKKFSRENYIINNTKKIIIFISIIIIALFAITSYRAYSYENFSYSVYVNDRLIGYVDTKSKFKDTFKDIISEIEDKYEDVNLKNARIKFKSIKKNDASITSYISLKSNILKSLIGTISADSLVINGDSFGYISSVGKNDLMKLLTEKYIKDINIERDKIAAVNIQGHIELKKESVPISYLDSIEAVAENIYEKNKSEKPVLNIEIIAKETFKEAIAPKTTIESTGDLYLGQSKNQEGIPGEKEVLKETTYSNGQVTSEKKISEKVITEAKDNIVYKGVKDPISGGIAFLKNPSRGSITSNYGMRWGRAHKGIDIAGNIGDPVKAALDGKIMEAYYSDSYGNVITIDHGNGIQTLYAHCSKLLGKVGQEVKCGDIIAKIGSTGRSTGPHLHFELRVNGSAINPIKYIE